MKYGYDLLRGALYDSSQETSAVEEYQNAMKSRADEIQKISGEIPDYDAVLITGPTYVNHLCGLPTITVAGGTFDTDGVRQAVMLYGTDEFRLYAAALTVEQLLNSKVKPRTNAYRSLQYPPLFIKNLSGSPKYRWHTSRR